MQSDHTLLALLVACVLGLAACGVGAAPEEDAADDAADTAATTPPSAPPALAAPSETTTERGAIEPPPGAEDATEPVAGTDGSTRPDWLGTRVLALGPSGFPPPRPTPPELDDRRLPPAADDLPAPASDTYAATATAVPPDVLARSTWHAGCPVDVEDLRIVGADELDLPPTGDGNLTTAFVCRDSRGAASWSQHAFGLAVDINPFHNPYLRGASGSAGALVDPGAVVLPELATSYVDRDRGRPGMVQPGDVVTRAFTEIGWGWGGDWSSLRDWMHFSRNGR